MKKFLFPIIAFAFIVFGFASCSLLNSSNEASVSFTIDSKTAQKLLSATNNRTAFNNSARSGVTQELQGMYCKISLKGGYEETKTVLIEEDTTINFSEIPVGISLYAEAVIYEQFDTSEEKVILFDGKSEIISVKSGENKLSIQLKRVEPDIELSTINLSVSLSYTPTVALQEYEVRVRNSSNEMLQKFSVESIDSPIVIENLYPDTYTVSVLGCATFSDVSYVYYYQKTTIAVSSGENKSSELTLGNINDTGTYIVISIQPQGQAATDWATVGSTNNYSCTITGNGVNFTVEDYETVGNGNNYGSISPSEWSSVKDKFLEPGFEYTFDVTVTKKGSVDSTWNDSIAVYTGSTTAIAEQSNYENQGSHAVTVNVE